MNVFVLVNVKKIEDAKKHENTQMSDVNGEMKIGDPDLTKFISVKKDSETLNTQINQLEIYNCIYDKKRDISGFIAGFSFDYFYNRNTFNGYLSASNNIMLLNVKTATGRSFINEANKELVGKCDFEPQSVDFELIESRVSSISGVVFSKINNAQINAKALYGSELASNDEFQELKSQGNISSITIVYPYNGDEYSIIISKKGSIFIRNSNVDLNTALDITLDVYKELMKE